MIYDQTLTIYELAEGSSPLSRKLKNGIPYYYAEKEVYASRFFISKQSGESISLMVEIPRCDVDARITVNQYCIPEDGKVYRIVQAQYGYDLLGLPITTLSLKEEDGKYDILRS